MTKYQISCFALQTSMHPPEKWSWIAISIWLWTHLWRHLILNTVLSQRIYWTRGCPQRFRSLTSGDDLTVITLSHLPPIFPQTISNSFFSRRNYYAQNSSLQYLYLHKEMVTVQSSDSLIKVCQYGFWKLLPSESFVWLLLAMLFFIDHLLQFLQVPLLFLVCSFPHFSPFQKVCKNHYTSLSSLCFQFTYHNTPRTVVNCPCHTVAMLTCAHLSYLLHLVIFLGWKLRTRVISRISMNTEFCKIGQ